MNLAEKLIEKTPVHRLTLFDRSFYSLGLLNHWHSTDVARHWLMPLKKNTQDELIRSLGRQDKVVRLTAYPQARKKFADLPEYIEAHILTKNSK